MLTNEICSRRKVEQPQRNILITLMMMRYGSAVILAVLFSLWFYLLHRPNQLSTKRRTARRLVLSRVLRFYER